MKKMCHKILNIIPCIKKALQEQRKRHLAITLNVKILINRIRISKINNLKKIS